jgi:DeoR family transcriptional regulator of aga operon
MNGGATLNNPYATDRDVNDKKKHLSEKVKIGATAAKLVNTNDSILNASGTTVLFLAKSIFIQKKT